MVRFHSTLSEESVAARYFQVLDLNRRTAHERLTRICFNDYDREIALVAETSSSDPAAREIVAVGRLTRKSAGSDAEVAFLVNDLYQNRGLGTQLMRLLVGIARREGLRSLFAVILTGNTVMQNIFRREGFLLDADDGGRQVRAELVL